MARIVIFGAGYVGLCTGVVFALWGHHVTLVDVDRKKVQGIQGCRPSFFEPLLEGSLRAVLKQGFLKATTDAKAAMKGAEFSFICVGTPAGPDGQPDCRAVFDVARTIKTAKPSFNHVVVVKSTVPPGTTEGCLAPLLPVGVPVVVNPEFLAEGSAMNDALNPSRVVLGAPTLALAKRVGVLYPASTKTVLLDIRSAEMVKYASNGFLALKVSYANEMAGLCEWNGVDWKQVASALEPDPRIGGYLDAGAGWGGSCLPKEVAALMGWGPLTGLIRGIQETNDMQPIRLVQMAREELSGLSGRRVALLGLAFKAGTDDCRNTQALPLWQELTQAGALVACYDPVAGPNFKRLAPKARVVKTAKEALRYADAVIVQAAWPEFDDAVRASRVPVVIDGRRCLSRVAGVRYRAIGLPA